MIQPSAASSRMFQAVALALKLVDRNIRNDINRESRATLNPVWRGIVGLNATSEMDRRILAKGARVAPGNPTTLIAASSKKALSGGLVPDDRATAAAFELGAQERNRVKTYDRKNRSGAGSHRVKRHTARQMPAPSKGRVVYSSFAEIAPRITSLWIQIVVRNIYEAHEER
jgi:hypothetical protein